MKSILKKAFTIFTLISVVTLNACSDKAAKNETTTVPEQQASPSLARTVEIDRGNGYSDTYEFNEKGLLIKEINYNGVVYGGEKDDSCSTIEYKYNDANQIIKSTSISGIGNAYHTLYKYNEDGKKERIEIITS